MPGGLEQHVVPAKAGTQNVGWGAMYVRGLVLDSRLRGNDGVSGDQSITAL